MWKLLDCSNAEPLTPSLSLAGGVITLRITRDVDELEKAAFSAWLAIAGDAAEAADRAPAHARAHAALESLYVAAQVVRARIEEAAQEQWQESLDKIATGLMILGHLETRGPEFARGLINVS